MCKVLIPEQLFTKYLESIVYVPTPTRKGMTAQWRGLLAELDMSILTDWVELTGSEFCTGFVSGLNELDAFALSRG